MAPTQTEIAVGRSVTPLFIGHDVYRGSSYGGGHPLAIPRVPSTTDLARALGWLDGPAYRDGPIASRALLERFHSPDYLDALAAAERDGALPEAAVRRYNIGGHENPIFPEVYRRPAAGVGGAVAAARLLATGAADRVYSPGGGTHHGRPDRASGFCFLNAPVIAIHTLLDAGIERVLYVDIDAHHGDGVEDAFGGDGRVLTVSLHEDGRWPRTGAPGCDLVRGVCNLPVPRGFNDTECRALVERAILPLAEAFRAPVTVVLGGADALADDPLARLELSNRALWDLLAAVSVASPRLLLLGGGGYNPWTVARCWAGFWGVLAGHDPWSAPLTGPGRAVLAGLDWQRQRGRPRPARWTETLADPPNEGPVRPEIDALIAMVRGALTA